MSNFLEKLKKGMEINELPEELKENTNKKDGIASQTFETNPDIDNEESEIKKEKPKKVHKKSAKNEFNEIKKEEPAENSAEENITPTAKSISKKIEIKTEKIEIEKEAPSMGDNWLEEEGQLTVDVYQTDKEIVIQSAVAGVKPEDLDILIENDIILIRGCRPKPLREENKNYFYQECHWGRFCREIVMPEEINNLQAKAGLNHGILTIRLPKTGRKDKKKLLIEED